MNDPEFAFRIDATAGAGANAIEAAFVEFGGGRHGFLPLNEYCGGALMENLGTWNEGDKRPHLRPGMELLVQVTKEESSIKGAAVTSYISIAGRYLAASGGAMHLHAGVSERRDHRSAETTAADHADGGWRTLCFLGHRVRSTPRGVAAGPRRIPVGRRP